MRFSWTIYPGERPMVGWYLYATGPSVDTPLCGDASTPLAEFANVIEGHRQWADFMTEVNRLRLWHHLPERHQA